MRLPSFQRHINYEKTRAVFADSEYMADVYDTPAWRKQTGEPAKDQTGSDDDSDDSLDNSLDGESAYYDEYRFNKHVKKGKRVLVVVA